MSSQSPTPEGARSLNTLMGEERVGLLERVAAALEGGSDPFERWPAADGVTPEARLRLGADLAVIIRWFFESAAIVSRLDEVIADRTATSEEVGR